MNSNGRIWTQYPIYPYKSKVAALAEQYQVNGGYWFLGLASVKSDPLYHA